jgi:hypothetical protein
MTVGAVGRPRGLADECTKGQLRRVQLPSKRHLGWMNMHLSPKRQLGKLLQRVSSIPRMKQGKRALAASRARGGRVIIRAVVAILA